MFLSCVILSKSRRFKKNKFWYSQNTRQTNCIFFLIITLVKKSFFLFFLSWKKTDEQKKKEKMKNKSSY